MTKKIVLCCLPVFFLLAVFAPPQGRALLAILWVVGFMTAKE